MKQTNRKRWQYALVQHPMWLIIAEDSVCGERTPPWGCASIEEYGDRLSASLDALDAFPEMKLSFDFSAVELEDVAVRRPDLLDRMRELASAGRLSFLNGTFSQPHLQMLSVESAIRQLQHGIEAIERLTGYRVRCYAGQEPGITPQLPQILRAMGCSSAATPDFPFGVRLIDGQTQHWDKRWEWLAGDDLVDWRAPDGSTIPVWLKTSGWPDEITVADEHQHGLLGRSLLRANMPDMRQVVPEWVSERLELCDFVRLDEAIEAYAERIPPTATANLDANYAYCEGVDAESLSRANARAESALLTLEALQVLAAPDSGTDGLKNAWKLLLKAQHHDAYWTGAPELRAKSLSWLAEVEDSARERTQVLLRSLAAHLPTPRNALPVLVASPYATPCRMPVRANAAGCTAVDEEGNETPVQTDGSGGSVFVAASEGLGYRTYLLRGEPPPPLVAEPLDGVFRYSNRHYAAVVRADAALDHLSARGRAGVLGPGGGNRWQCTDGGREVHPELVSASVTRGPVFDAVDSRTRIGPAAVSTRVTLYHELPWFEVLTTLWFDEPAEIGNYFDDRTKLHHAWHLSHPAAINHAVGGCLSEARPGRSFVASPWVDCGGLAICFFGASKCWVDEDGCLRSVVAWGHNGDRFHNRQGPLRDIMGPLNWCKPMDLRLRGSYTVRYAVWPHGRQVRPWQVAGWAAALMLPPVACCADGGDGSRPHSNTLLSSQMPGVVPLSVRGDAERVVVRMMELSGRSHDLNLAGDAARDAQLRELGGERARRIGPHKIVEAVLTPPAQ